MFKLFIKSIREYKKSTIATPCLVVLEVLMEVIIPLLMANLIDFGIEQGSLDYIAKIGAFLLLSAGMSILFGVLAGINASKASCGFAKNLRQDMFYKIQAYSFSNIDKFSTSSLVTRLTTDVTNVQNSFQMLTRMAIRAPIMLISALVVCFTINAKLSLIYLACIPVLGLGIFLIVRRAFPLFTKVFKGYDKLNNVVQENVKGIRVVKSFNREDFETKKFKTVSEEIFQNFSKAEKTIALNMPFVQLILYISMILLSWFGAKSIVTSGGTDLTTGQLLSMFTYTFQILMSLVMLSMVLVMLTISKASAIRIKEVLLEEPDIKNPESPIKKVKNGEIIFKNVDFLYSKNSEKKVLNNVNIKIKSGETIGIIGGTGSSKSSFVQLIPRLYDTQKGSVKVGGVDVKKYDLETLRNEVAMVLQKNELFSGTIKENLCWGNETASDEEIIHACRLAQADEFINQLPNKYDTFIEQGGSNVSGGQKQRLCIARALLKKPKILILDDSTSAVDTKTDMLIRDAFMSEIPDITKIIIAQRITSVQDANKIIVLDDGKISGIGTHEELLNSNLIYKEVYESQIKGEN